MKKRIISGIMVSMFLVTMLTVAFPVRVSAQFQGQAKVGVIGPKGWIQWDGMKEGAELARDMINHPEDFGLPGWGPNNQGGMYNPDDGKYYELVLVEIDEHAVPIPDPTAAVADLLKALDDNPTMKIVVGGFRTDVVLPMREAAMDYAAVHDRPIWMICGASEDFLIDDGPDLDNPYDDVREDYERYKYMFRATPMNSSWLGLQLFYMIPQLQAPKLSALFGSPLPTYIIAEDFTWCDHIIGVIQENAPDLGISIVKVARPSGIETDFGPFLDAIEASGAKLIIHIFSAVAGASFIKQWGERKIPAVPIGINVESQLQEFYTSIGGKCEYETIMGQGTRTNMNPEAEPLNAAEWWDLYSARFGHSPIYTAQGTWGLILGLNTSAAAGWIGKPCGWSIPNVFEPWENLNAPTGYFKYTKYHDLYCDQFCLTPIWPPAGWPGTLISNYGTSRALIPQWQVGRLEVVWPRGKAPAPGSLAPLALQDPTPLPWARKWKIPLWVYSLAETDFAGGPLIPSPPVASGSTPAGFFGYFTSPDGSVGVADMTAVTGMWQKTCTWTLLEADMDGNQYIDIDDVARVAIDWGKTA